MRGSGSAQGSRRGMGDGGRACSRKAGGAEDLSFCLSRLSCSFFRGGESSPERGFAPGLERQEPVPALGRSFQCRLLCSPGKLL